MTATVKRCVRCGADLDCGAGMRECWCSEVDTTASVLARLRALYDDCLCPACLRDEALCNAEPAVVDPPHGTAAS